jgi:hypothetical protein
MPTKTGQSNMGEWVCPACDAVIADRLLKSPCPPIHEHDGRPVALVEKG